MFELCNLERLYLRLVYVRRFKHKRNPQNKRRRETLVRKKKRKKRKKKEKMLIRTKTFIFTYKKKLVLELKPMV